jgi:fructose-1,6-bisphosphatase I
MVKADAMFVAGNVWLEIFGRGVRTMAQGVTAKQFCTQHGGAALGSIVDAIATASRDIERSIRFAGLNDVYGAAGAENVQGEQQQKLDVLANELLIGALSKTPAAAAAVSEEDEDAIAFDHAEAEFVVIFDPLDGSSNIDVNVNVGTIVSVQRFTGDVQTSALAPGAAQAAAVAVVYGPSTVMMLALQSVDGIAFFTLNKGGEFVLTQQGANVPQQGPYYSANEANEAMWPDAYRRYVQQLRDGSIGGAHGSRYIGSLVADFYRTLLKGGVFFYPQTAKSPKGKLRLLYEANPLAMIVEKGGGAATNGEVRILDLKPEALHQRTPLVIGSRLEVEALAAMMRKVEDK